MQDTAPTHITSDQAARQRAKENIVAIAGLSFTLAAAVLLFWFTLAAHIVWIMGILCAAYVLHKATNGNSMSTSADTMAKISLSSSVAVGLLLLFV